jgi:hypothetical protein
MVARGLLALGFVEGLLAISGRGKYAGAVLAGKNVVVAPVSACQAHGQVSGVRLRI